MDSVQPIFTGQSAVGEMGPMQPTQGLFGYGGDFNSASAMSFGGTVATGFGAYSSVQSGQQMKAQYDMQEAQYKTQADIIKVNAKEQAVMLRKELLQNLGSANASAAARGLDTGSGTPRQIVIESIGNVESDIAKLESGATISAASSRTSAARAASAGASAAQAGYYKGAQSIASYALK